MDRLIVYAIILTMLTVSCRNKTASEKNNEIPGLTKHTVSTIVSADSDSTVVLIEDTVAGSIIRVTKSELPLS